MLAQSRHENEHQDSVVETITPPVAGDSHGRTIHNASQNLRRRRSVWPVRRRPSIRSAHAL